MSPLFALWQRAVAVTGRLSMYRLTLAALGALTLVALVVSLFGVLAPTPAALVVSAVVLSATCVGVDALARRLLHLPARVESALITGAILLFVLRPTLDPWGLLGLVVAAVVAMASKYLIVWRRRHLLNPAAIGALALSLIAAFVPQLGAAAWWVGSPFLAGFVAVAGLVILVRTEKLRVAAVFLVIAIAVGVIRAAVQYEAAGVALETWSLAGQMLWSSPFLFLAAFLLPEPLTLPPRRRQQLIVAVVMGFFAGWPLAVGPLSFGPEGAVVIGNLVAFALARRGRIPLTLVAHRAVSPTVRELVLRTGAPVPFRPGQYLELDVPHPRPDARGTRREFSIVSLPGDLPELRLAYRAPAADGAASSFKRALADLDPGAEVAATGVWGDFVLPERSSSPVVLVAAGIGITPMVALAREAAAGDDDRDVVLVYIAANTAELAFADELAATGTPVVVVTRDRPDPLPGHWTWAGGARLDAAGLARLVPDLSSRHAYVSGPPALIAQLAPALKTARSVTADAFAGY